MFLRMTCKVHHKSHASRNLDVANVEACTAEHCHIADVHIQVVRAIGHPMPSVSVPTVQFCLSIQSLHMQQLLVRVHENNLMVLRNSVSTWECAQQSHMAKISLQEKPAVSSYRLLAQMHLTFKILFCCNISREMFRGRSSLSTMPFTKPRYSGMRSSQLSMMKTRRTYSLMLFCFFLVSNRSKGARLHDTSCQDIDKLNEQM